MLNAIISGEPVQVDRKYRDPINITPRCKVAWAMNELLRIGSLDDGIFRRIAVMEIPEIPPEKRDPQVKEDVKRSGAAILNWALVGLERLRKRGHFEIPESIRNATEEFREHNDVPAMFVSERCDKGVEFWEASSNLYTDYKDWCYDNGHKLQSSTSVAREWKRLGFEKWRTNAGVRWKGVKLRSAAATAYRPQERV